MKRNKSRAVAYFLQVASPHCIQEKDQRANVRSVSEHSGFSINSGSENEKKKEGIDAVLTSKFPDNSSELQ